MPRSLDPFAVRFGRNLRRLRSIAGLSQDELGRRLGVSFQQVQKYERGGCNMSVSALYRLKHIFGCYLDDFFVEDAGLREADAALRDRQQRIVYRVSRAVLAIDSPDVQERLIRLAQAIKTESSTGHRMNVRALERLRALDPTFNGDIPAAASFSIWLRHAVCRGYLSESHRGFFLTPDQAERWKSLGADLS